MGFEGEFASYEPLRRIADSEKYNALLTHVRIQKKDQSIKNFDSLLVYKKDLLQNLIQPSLIIFTDGSSFEKEIEKGFPSARLGVVTIASVLTNLDKIKQLLKDDFIDPKEFRKTEDNSFMEAFFPGCNVVMDSEKDAKASLRRRLFEELKSKDRLPLTNGETLLETYEYLLHIKLQNTEVRRPKSPIDGIDSDMIYDRGEYICPHSGEALFSTDALRLHELMNPSGTNIDLFNQIMSTIEKLWLVNILRSFEKLELLPVLRYIAFIMDGPLAVFGTASWLTKVIETELRRINDLQKKVNDNDMIILGIEKSGAFFNHFIDIDTSKDGIDGVFPKQTALLLTDEYVKKNIIYSESTKPYGYDTYFGRRFFYKTVSGQKLVPVLAWFSDEQKNIKTANINQFPRLGDVLQLLDSLASNRYPNSISPLISVHAEVAIPLNLGNRLFDDIAREIREKSKT
jgi:hypothetical protein